MLRSISTGLALVCALLLAPRGVAAQRGIALSEIVPALEGSELGAVQVGDAPATGSSRTVRRVDVLRALRRAGRSAEGLVIPRATRVRRRVRTLDRERLVALVTPALAAALRPCGLQEVRPPASVRVAAGPITVRVQGHPPRRDGHASLAVVLKASGGETHVSVRVALSCPPPDVSAGSHVRIVARVGNVRASIGGEARQPGRVGDVIRVSSGLVSGSLRARVLDAHTVEVLR